MTREITNAFLNHTITEELNTDCIYKQCILINSNFISAERKDRDSSRHGTDHDTEQLSTRDSSRHGTAHDTGQLTTRDSSRHGTAHDTGQFTTRDSSRHAARDTSSRHGTGGDTGQVATRDRSRHAKKKKREKKRHILPPLGLSLSIRQFYFTRITLGIICALAGTRASWCAAILTRFLPLPLVPRVS